MMTTAISISAFIVAAISLPLSVMAFIEIRAMAKSTHRIQYVPVDESAGDRPEQFLKKMYNEEETQI